MSQALLGLPTIILIAWVVSERRRAFPLRLVLTGVIAQLVLAALLTACGQTQGPISPGSDNPPSRWGEIATRGY